MYKCDYVQYINMYYLSLIYHIYLICVEVKRYNRERVQKTFLYSRTFENNSGWQVHHHHHHQHHSRYYHHHYHHHFESGSCSVAHSSLKLELLVPFMLSRMIFPSGMTQPRREHSRVTDKTE